MNAQTMTKSFFEEGTDIEEELLDLINPDSFVQHMKEIGEIDSISNQYGDDVYKLCRNSIAWVISKLNHTPYIYDLQIVEGLFNNQDHAWIQIGDFNVDLTLAQFIICPKFAVSLVENEKRIGYQREEVLNYMAWVKQQ